MLACLALSPFGNVMAAHHSGDVDAVVTLSDGAGKAKVSSDHPASLPLVDHDCHCCSIAVHHAPVWTPMMRVPMAVALLSENLVDGHAPGAEFRPPKS